MVNINEKDSKQTSLKKDSTSFPKNSSIQEVSIEQRENIKKDIKHHQIKAQAVFQSYTSPQESFRAITSNPVSANNVTEGEDDDVELQKLGEIELSEEVAYAKDKD